MERGGGGGHVYFNGSASMRTGNDMVGVMLFDVKQCICSLYFNSNLCPVSPIYELLHVWHFI